MLGVKLACVLKDPTVSVGVIGWLIRVTVNLTRSVQYPVEGGWSILAGLKWLLLLTGLRIVKSGVHRCVAYITATGVFGLSWLTVAISDFRSARATGVVAFTSKPVVFSRAEADH